MKYIKPFINQTKDFETITIRLVFPFEEQIDNLAKNEILPNMLVYMSQKYDTEEKFKTQKLENYILSLNCSTHVIGTSGFFIFNLVIPDPKILPENRLKEALELLKETVYNPKVDDNGFDQFQLNREIKNIKISLENCPKNLRGYISYRVDKLLDDENIYSRDLIYYQEQLEELDTKSLFKYYQEVIQKNNPYIFVSGNIDKTTITNLLKKYFYDISKNYAPCLKNYNYFLVPRKDAQIIKDIKNFKQSGICIVFKIKNFSIADQNILKQVRNLLNFQSTRLLFNKLRTQEKLIYSASAKSSSRFGLLKIEAFVDKNKLEYTKEKILEVIEEIKDEKYIQNLLPTIIEDYRLSRLRLLDDRYFKLDDIMDQFLGLSKKYDDVYQEMISIKAKDITNLTSRFVLDTILYVQEENNE